MMELERVGFVYPGGGKVLDGVSAKFCPGRFYGIFGPNGGGKSTLLRLLSGELTPRTGRVAPVWRDPLIRARHLAVVEQEIPVRIPLSVREVVALGRYPWTRGGETSSAAVAEALERLQLTELAGKPYCALSGGERQRVMLARALAQATPLLLLDEPASSLDIGFQHKFYRLLRELASAGRCVVMVSHDFLVAPGYLDEVLLLSGGRLAGCGRPEEVLSSRMLHEVFDCPEPRENRSAAGCGTGKK